MMFTPLNNIYGAYKFSYENGKYENKDDENDIKVYLNYLCR